MSTTMTDVEHRQEATHLSKTIARLRSKSKMLPTLAEKIQLAGEIKQLEEQLRQHRLNYFDLVRT